MHCMALSFNATDGLHTLRSSSKKTASSSHDQIPSRVFLVLRTLSSSWFPSSMTATVETLFLWLEIIISVAFNVAHS
ncbi:hypothetical protein FHG87_007524 [Trinorchestia longiramus]|nr:hypothetical protein FHG87_007524 [Trinorchestia longiramus]